MTINNEIKELQKQIDALKNIEISEKLLAIAEYKDVEFYADGKWEINKELSSYALDWLCENIDEIRIKPDPNFLVRGTVNWSQND